MQKLKINRLVSCVSVCFLFAVLLGCGSDQSSNTNTQQTFLPVEEAFIYSVKVDSDNLIKANWIIADGYRLYKDQFKFSVSPDAYQITHVSYPPAQMFDDKNLGKKESYKNSVEITIAVSGESSLSELELTSKYQGCADVGLCYPPETRNNTLKLLK